MNKGKMNTLINKLSDAPFKYGENDCFKFTNALVKEWHGKDFRPQHKYKTKTAALKYMADFGGIEALTTGTLGYSCDPELCGDGDVVSADIAPNEIGLGFVFDGWALFKGPKTVYKMRLRKCRMGWRLS